MMNKKNAERKSTCSVCGKRLSAKAPEGGIQWQPSHVGDNGLYCDTCYVPGVMDQANTKPRIQENH
jgi:hypothetical protein